MNDYGFRANHAGTDLAKALIATCYGSPVKRAYFHGCSSGGRDASMLALRAGASMRSYLSWDAQL